MKNNQNHPGRRFIYNIVAPALLLWGFVNLVLLLMASLAILIAEILTGSSGGQIVSIIQQYWCDYLVSKPLYLLGGLRAWAWHLTQIVALCILCSYWSAKGLKQ